MRRRSRKSVINLIGFAIVLILILYLNRPTSHRTYSWTKISYRTRSITSLPIRGICPDLADSLKPALVVARVEADGSTNWLSSPSIGDKYHLCIYTADAPISASNNLQLPANRGHEAMAYLTFIIDNYVSIPASGAVFVHGSRFAWHNDHPDYDNAALLSLLNVSAALAPHGYHNLRCDWTASTCSAAEALPQGSLETKMRAVLEPWNMRAVSDQALPGALLAIFGDNTDLVSQLGRDDAIRSQCCAQFVVARNSIWRWEKEEYVALRQWLLDGSAGSRTAGKTAAPSDDRVAGRILSYVWHILFIRERRIDSQEPLSNIGIGVDLQRLNTLACPHAGECYCRLYGRCGLECSSGSCLGQYRLPQDLKLPEDWASMHT